MAKKAEKGKEEAGKGNGAQAGASEPAGKGESVAGYFRKVFEENPKLLRRRSNDELFRRWLEDHPGHDEVPQTVKVGLQNIKSVLRKERGRRGRPPREAPVDGEGQVPARRVAPRDLDAIEERIDECLSLARGLDPEEFGDVVTALRRARNLVVWMAEGGGPPAG